MECVFPDDEYSNKHNKYDDYFSVGDFSVK
jgi:hypothetical protein